MSIPEAIKIAAKANGWSLTKIAAEVGITEGAARKWFRDGAIPSGDKLEMLRVKLPGLAALLNARSEEAA